MQNNQDVFYVEFEDGEVVRYDLAKCKMVTRDNDTGEQLISSLERLSFKTLLSFLDAHYEAEYRFITQEEANRLCRESGFKYEKCE